VKLKSLLICASVCLSLVSARPGFSQQLQPLQNDPPLVSQMLQEGWDKVAEGVLQRTGGGGKVETFTYGEDGLRWNARKLEARLDHFQKEYAAHPSEELAGLIETIKTDLVGVDQSLKEGVGQAELPTGEDLDACNISYDALAAADPLTGSQTSGTTATATATFSATCGQTASSYAYAYATATQGTVTTVKIQEDPKSASTSVVSSATASAPGNTGCYSEALARVTSSVVGGTYEVSDTNYTCPYDPHVSISGPTDVWLDYYQSCQTVTWTAAASGGASGYSYYWYIAGAYQGTGSTLSKTYCQTNQRVDVSVTAYDANSQSATGAFTTWIYYDNSCNSGCGCQTPNYYPPYYYDQPICP
jgi:hypothetical protein